MNDYDSHVISVLMQFYVDNQSVMNYNGRWDTWLIAKNLMDEYFYMMLKSDMHVNHLLNLAKTGATQIYSSPLKNALKEE
jgi:hypothetical protein